MKQPLPFVVDVINYVEVHMNACCQPGVHPDPNRFQTNFSVHDIILVCYSCRKLQKIVIEQANNINQSLSFIVHVAKHIEVYTNILCLLWVPFFRSAIKYGKHTRYVSLAFLSVRSSYPSAFSFLSFPWLLFTHYLSLLIWFMYILECSFLTVSVCM